MNENMMQVGAQGINMDTRFVEHASGIVSELIAKAMHDADKGDGSINIEPMLFNAYLQGAIDMHSNVPDDVNIWEFIESKIKLDEHRAICKEVWINLKQTILEMKYADNPFMQKRAEEN
jgi:hypothetical protein